MRIRNLAAGLLFMGWASFAPAAERFVGQILDMSGTVPSWHERFVLHIEELSSDAEVSRLRTVLREKGTVGLHEALRETKQKGWVRVADAPTPFYGIARVLSAADGSLRVQVLTERAIMPVEGRVSPRAGDYPFGWIELTIDANGKGEGRVTAAASIRVTGNELEMVGFGEKPFQLRNIRREAAD